MERLGRLFISLMQLYVNIYANTRALINGVYFLKLTWLMFHWQKGVPYADVVDKQQGKFDRLTMWEQMDLGVQFTPTRKFFTIVPIVLYVVLSLILHSNLTHFLHQSFIITTHYNELQKPLIFWVNFAFFLLLIVSKLPSMHKVRVFGINKE